MATETNLEKLQRLLRQMFQFDCADLDFGIYRIMNHKRDAVERFIQKNLVEAIGKEISSGVLAGQSQVAAELQEVADQIRETLGEGTLNGDGRLAEAYHKTPLGKRYLDLQARATGAQAKPALEAAIFNHLYTFFSRYYDAGDFLSKRRYSRKEKYAIPYNGEEVYLHWANSDQYYVKTSEYFTDYCFKGPNGVTVHFRLQAADIEKDNVKGDKRFFVPLPKEAAFDGKAKEIVIPFEYRPLTAQEEVKYGQRNQQETILAEAQEAILKHLGKADAALAALMAVHHENADEQQVTCLEHHLRQYTQRNTSDFFIHKDLKGFLLRELDFYLKNEVLNLDDVEAAGEIRAEGWFQVMRIIRAIGERIILFLAQIEDFQKRLFEKKKFIVETNYCVTVGNIAEAFHDEIAANEAQWQEWKDLFHVDEEEKNLFSAAAKSKKDRRAVFLKAHPTLVLDTRHFDQDFKDRLLASFDNLDDITDGLLIHSENFQALNLLLEKYREKVKCIYIDPPYNTGKDGFIYKDQYQRSSWLSMIEDRVAVARTFLASEGVMFVSIDDHQLQELRSLIDGLFGREAFVSVFVWNTEGHTDNQFQVKVNHEYILCYGYDPQHVALGAVVDPNTRQGSNLWRGFAENSITKNGPGNPPSEVTLPAGFPCAASAFHLPPTDVPDEFYRQIAQRGYITREMTRRFQLDYPIRKDGMVAGNGKLVSPCRVFTGWANVKKLRRFIDSGMTPLPEEGGSTTFYLSGNGVIYYKKERVEAQNILSVLRNMGTTEQTRYELEHMGLQYMYPKPTELIQHVISIGGAAQDWVLDFFAGSGTTGDAVMRLNRADDRKRRFVLVEMSEYFDTVLLPRIKKVTFTPEWKDGKPVRQATTAEAERGLRIVKYIRLESYEDALNNISFTLPKGQKVLEFDDYLLKYMLAWETKESETLLNVEKLASPFSYALTITDGQQAVRKTVDIPETFAYVLGLHVKTRRACQDNDRRYLVYRGRIDHRRVVVIWRDTKDWDKKDYERDKKFVAEQKLAEGADAVFVNGDSFVPGARALEPVFKGRMFGGL